MLVLAELLPGWPVPHQQRERQAARPKPAIIKTYFAPREKYGLPKLSELEPRAPRQYSPKPQRPSRLDPYQVV